MRKENDLGALKEESGVRVMKKVILLLVVLVVLFGVTGQANAGYWIVRVQMYIPSQDTPYEGMVGTSGIANFTGNYSTKLYWQSTFLGVDVGSPEEQPAGTQFTYTFNAGADPLRLYIEGTPVDGSHPTTRTANVPMPSPITEGSGVIPFSVPIQFDAPAPPGPNSWKIGLVGGGGDFVPQFWGSDAGSVSVPWTLTTEAVFKVYLTGGNFKTNTIVPELPIGMLIPLGVLLFAGVLWIRRKQVVKA